jgi:hypothetical protein
MDLRFKTPDFFIFRDKRNYKKGGNVSASIRELI